jgi:hypothetical protein
MPLVERLSGNKRKIKNGTLLHIWLRSRDTFTHLGKATGTLLHIWKKQSGHFYTSGRSNQDTFTHLGRHKTIVLGRFYTTNGNTLNKSQVKTLC